MKKTMFTILSILLLLTLTTATFANDIVVITQTQDDGSVKLGLRFFGTITNFGCIAARGVKINHISITSSKWQMLGENGNWQDVPGTEQNGLCGLIPELSGEYRWVGQGTSNGVATTFVSDNTVVVQASQPTQPEPTQPEPTQPEPAPTVPTVLVVDPDSPPIYWIDNGINKIQRVNLDGSDVQDLVTSSLKDPSGIALDVSGGKMYWIDGGTDKIQRANLDGSDIEDLVTGLPRPLGIALDVLGGKMYWTHTDWNSDTQEFMNGKIQRANLDGSNVEDLITSGLLVPWGIALDVSGGKMYWTDLETDKIQRSNLDGSDVQDLVTQGASRPLGIALDVVGGKMYWTDYGTDKIQRSNLDGSDVEDLVTQGLQLPTSIALDVAGGKMYWADSNTDKIQRANLDGSNIQDLVTQGLDIPIALALAIPPQTTPTTPEPEPVSTILRIHPASIESPDVGEELTISLNIVDSEAITGYQATVQYDTSALRYVSAANGDFLPAGSFIVGPMVEGNLVSLGAILLKGVLNGDGTLATITFEVIEVKDSTLTLSDVLLAKSSTEGIVPQLENAVITVPTKLKEDLNGDGVVNILDIVAVASAIGETGDHVADINGDGVVNILDIVAVAGAIGQTPAAPALMTQALSTLTAEDVKSWLTQTQALPITDATSLQGIQFLEQLLKVLTPKQTALLPNYPNPFNPETWIPYQLSKPADVTLTIYDIKGHVIRVLDLGHQRAGLYQARSRAAHWDGKNALGEPAASGVYFYTLTAGDFSATRKMLILK